MLFKEIAIPSGFVEEKLRKLLKTFDTPDPPRIIERLETLTKPEDQYRVRWITSNQFEFKCFKFLDGSNNLGYSLVDRVKVRLVGPIEQPFLKVHLQKKWFSLLKAVAGLAMVYGALFLILYLTDAEFNQSLSIYGWIFGIVSAISFLPVVYRTLMTEDFCVARLRHLLAKDDWDPGVVKSN